MEYFLIEDRAIISISGVDKAKFLQGIITNDVAKINSDSYIYALMLNPQGKLLYDFFITLKGDSYLLDCPKPYVEQIIKRFNIYKLRSEVKISDKPEDYKIYTSFNKLNELFMPDPRDVRLGFRAVIEPSITLIGRPQGTDLYNKKRMDLLIPDMVHDLEPETFFPLELHLDELNAIDYKKGCYVGQEVTARTHYRGVVRKKIYRVELIEGEIPPPKAEIFFGEKKIGVTLGFVEDCGLSLLRIEEVESAKGLLFSVDNSIIRVIV